MKITKKLAVALHRKLWNWIADETERQHCRVEKEEYPLFKRLLILNKCWCCEYAQGNCEECPIVWHIRNKFLGGSPCELAEFRDWENAMYWCESARLARVIAELPERDV